MIKTGSSCSGNVLRGEGKVNKERSGEMLIVTEQSNDVPLEKMDSVLCIGVNS